MEYIIWCDESDQIGKYYSNFYGGVLVRSTHLDEVINRIESAKRQLHLFKEVKWSKVTENYLDKYISLMDVFFDLLAEDKVKVRIMFTKNSIVPTNLTADHKNREYYLLYYQFLKHAFGLQYSNDTGNQIYLRIYLDWLPLKREKNKEFKEYLYRLQRIDDFRLANLCIRRDDIAEVDSKSHNVMQCMDVVLGSMSFKLNDKHKELLPGKRRRGRKTIAKERLVKHIQKRIFMIYPNFNIGISTGTRNRVENRWLDPYRHWCFTPNGFIVDDSKNK
jgi:hypothetical protein